MGDRREEARGEMATHLRIAGLALVAVFGAAACGGGTTTIETDQGDIQVDVEDGSATYTDEQGNTAEFGAGAELPDDWPSSFPLPDGVVPFSTVSSSEGMTVSFLPGDADAASFADFYDEALPAAGWTIDERFESSAVGTVSVNYVVSAEGWEGYVMVTSSDSAGAEEPAIVVALSKA